MSARPVSREYRIYLAIWRKAYKAIPEIIKINCSSRSMAIAMRQGMYRAIRPYRTGDLIDEELRIAAEKFVVYIDKEEHTLELRERMTLSHLEGMFDEIGIDEEDLKLGEERKVDASLNRLLEVQEETHRSTPFYTRDE